MTISYFARPEPLDEQLRVGEGAEDEVARGVELAADVDERDAVGRLDLRFGHGRSSWLRSSIDHSLGRRRIDPASGRVGLEAGEQRVEAPMALVPPRLVLGEPFRGVAERRRLEVAQPGGRAPRPRDQPGSLEDLEVARDRRLRHRERPAISATVRSPAVRRARIARRVGSARAPKTASRLVGCISITTTLWNNVVIEADRERCQALACNSAERVAAAVHRSSCCGRTAHACATASRFPDAGR